MPDRPDYSGYLPGSVRFSLDDMGELAARLNSPVVYDRRGEVIFMDNFSTGLNGWETESSGAGSSVSLSADNVFRWPYVAHFVAGTTLLKYAQIFKGVGAFDSNRIGLEVCSSHLDDYNFVQIIFSGNMYDFDFEAIVRITRSNAMVSIEDDQGNFVDVGNISGIDFGDPVYIPWKIVIDMSTGKYVRLLVGGQQFDLSQYSFVRDPNPFQSFVTMAFQIWGNAGSNAHANLALVILTANEPL